ncbi:hypothetical protein D3C84_1200570 [compost metagenome]
MASAKSMESSWVRATGRPLMALRRVWAPWLPIQRPAMKLCSVGVLLITGSPEFEACM